MEREEEVFEAVQAGAPKSLASPPCAIGRDRARTRPGQMLQTTAARSGFLWNAGGGLCKAGLVIG